jgi:hypothetical protein
MLTDPTRIRLSRAILALAALLLLGGCASTSHYASSWRNSEYRGAPLKKVVVFATAKDPAIRRLAEDRAVDSLPAGTAGVQSYKLFDKPEMDEEKLRARLAKEGFDAALISRMITVDQSQPYVAPQTQIQQPYPWYAYEPYYRSFYTYYVQANTHIVPGYVTETSRSAVETILYQLPQGDALWSGVSETVSPNSSVIMVNELSRIVATSLTKEGLLGQAAARPTPAAKPAQAGQPAS